MAILGLKLRNLDPDLWFFELKIGTPIGRLFITVIITFYYDCATGKALERADRQTNRLSAQ